MTNGLPQPIFHREFAIIKFRFLCLGCGRAGEENRISVGGYLLPGSFTLSFWLTRKVVEGFVTVNLSVVGFLFPAGLR